MKRNIKEAIYIYENQLRKEDNVDTEITASEFIELYNLSNKNKKIDLFDLMSNCIGFGFYLGFMYCKKINRKEKKKS